MLDMLARPAAAHTWYRCSTMPTMTAIEVVEDGRLEFSSVGVSGRHSPPLKSGIDSYR